MTETTETIACPECTGKLRLPVRQVKLRVTCPHCQRQFVHSRHEYVSEPAQILTPTDTASTPIEPNNIQKEGNFQAKKSYNFDDLYEGLIRWPLSLMLALFSYYLLRDYEGAAFWMLFCLHLLIAGVVGTLVAMWLSKRGIWSFLDEFLVRATVFSGWLLVANLGAGEMATDPISQELAQLTSPLFSLQNELVTENVQPEPLVHHKAVDGFWPRITNWIEERRLAMIYSSLDDGGWDGPPMAIGDLRQKIEISYLRVRNSGRILAELEIVNKSNTAVRALIVNVNVGAYRSENIRFSISTGTEPILPGTGGLLLATLPPDFERKAITRLNGKLDWTSQKLQTSIQDVVADRFDRFEYFERNLDAWLEQ